MECFEARFYDLGSQGEAYECDTLCFEWVAHGEGAGQHFAGDFCLLLRIHEYIGGLIVNCGSCHDATCDSPSLPNLASSLPAEFEALFDSFEEGIKCQIFDDGLSALENDFFFVFGFPIEGVDVGVALLVQVMLV